MKLQKLYLLWLAAVAMSLVIGVLFYLIVMQITYGNFTGYEAFDGLVYIIVSIIIMIFSTGIFSALLVRMNKKTHRALRTYIATRLFVLSSIFGVFCVATFAFAIIYLNPLGLLIFAGIPALSWAPKIDRKYTKRNNWIFAGVLAGILLLGAMLYVGLILSDPYHS